MSVSSKGSQHSGQSKSCTTSNTCGARRKGVVRDEFRQGGQPHTDTHTHCAVGERRARSCTTHSEAPSCRHPCHCNEQQRTMPVHTCDAATLTNAIPPHAPDREERKARNGGRQAWPMQAGVALWHMREAPKHHRRYQDQQVVEYVTHLHPSAAPKKHTLGAVRHTSATHSAHPPLRPPPTTNFAARDPVA